MNITIQHHEDLHFIAHHDEHDVVIDWQEWVSFPSTDLHIEPEFKSVKRLTDEIRICGISHVMQYALQPNVMEVL